MIKNTKFLTILTLLMISCAKLEQDYPQRNFYVLDTQRNSGERVNTFDKILEVSRFNISPKFAGREFIYKTAENKYTPDFYNQFFKSPETLINNETYDWLHHSGIFKNVINRSIQIEADYILDANISEIYVDLSNPAETKSILSIQFFITGDTQSDTILIFNKKYSENISTEDRSSESFVKSWNKALESILTNFEKDIEKLAL